MSENDKSAPPTQAQLSGDLGRAIMGHAYSGSSIGVSTTGEIHAYNARSQAEKQDEQDGVAAGVAEAGKHFAMLKNQVTLLEKKLAEQADEMTWLKTERATSGKKLKKKDKGK